MTRSDEGLAPGTRVAGKYSVEGVIGEGGFGVVYRARADDGQPVALKVLSAAIAADPDGEARFRREADLARRLTHPNTVRILDHGRDASVWFIAFELLEGRSLEEELRGGALSPERARAIAIQVLFALEEAHGIGLVHRDLKPANIFLLEGTSLRVKVLDFGIAKSTNPGTASGVTREGTALGTPAYMAPEQVGGKVGAAVDVFALGIVTAEMLIGRSLFPADTPPMDLLSGRLRGDALPFPASVRASALGPIIERATSHRADDRYASAGDMRAALAEILPRPSDELSVAPTDAGIAYQPTLADPLAPTAVTPVPAGTPRTAIPAAPGPSAGRPRRWLWLAAVPVLVGLGGAGWWIMARTPSKRTKRPPPTATADPNRTFAKEYKECAGLASVDERSLLVALAALDWKFMGKTALPRRSELALQLRRGDQKGVAAILRFEDEGKAHDYKESIRPTDNDVTFLYEPPSAVLRLDMDQRDADALLERLCETQ